MFRNRLNNSLNLSGRVGSHGGGSSAPCGAGEQFEDGGRLREICQLKRTLPQCWTLFKVYNIRNIVLGFDVTCELNNFNTFLK